MFFDVMQQRGARRFLHVGKERKQRKKKEKKKKKKERKKKQMHAGRGSNLAAPIRDPFCNNRNHSAQTNLERTASRFRYELLPHQTHPSHGPRGATTGL
jgi:hypothetical protein